MIHARNQNAERDGIDAATTTGRGVAVATAFPPSRWLGGAAERRQSAVGAAPLRWRRNPPGSVLLATMVTAW